MRLLHLSAQGLAPWPSDAPSLPEHGFVWCVAQQEALDAADGALTALLQRWGLPPPLELHLRDLLNPQHPSNHDATRDYDLLVFRQLVLDEPDAEPATPSPPAHRLRGGKAGGPPILARLGTQPVGFVVYDRLLLTVHGPRCTTDDQIASRLADMNPARLPSTPADLMLRMLNDMVDRFLALRKPLTEQLDHWEAELLDPSTRFVNWRALLAARNNLHALEDLCDGQRQAVQQWLQGLAQQPLTAAKEAQMEREVLGVRARDVIEHIDRVVRHVQRLEQNAESAVQMHFSAQSHRTNEIMKTLTALTAVFLPLNLITGFFGMNFEFLPLIHSTAGLWWAVGTMATIAVGLVAVFWRKRYLARSGR
ncbi:MAG TPA: magnesium transporter CorA family protein [Burkholderiaceae bacterium]|nr:magnesium transporter CorA family protein [Burkholderiaceae bacterium]